MLPLLWPCMVPKNSYKTSCIVQIILNRLVYQAGRVTRQVNQLCLAKLECDKGSNFGGCALLLLSVVFCCCMVARTLVSGLMSEICTLGCDVFVGCQLA